MESPQRPATHELWGLGFCTLHAVRFVGSERAGSDVFLITGRAIVSRVHDVRGEEATAPRYLTGGRNRMHVHGSCNRNRKGRSTNLGNEGPPTRDEMGWMFDFFR